MFHNTSDQISQKEKQIIIDLNYQLHLTIHEHINLPLEPLPFIAQKLSPCTCPNNTSQLCKAKVDQRTNVRPAFSPTLRKQFLMNKAFMFRTTIKKEIESPHFLIFYRELA